MPPNPSKVMAPVQMQSSPVQRKSRANMTGLVANMHDREQTNRVKVKDRGQVVNHSRQSPRAVTGSSPKMVQTANHGQVQSNKRPKAQSPTKSGQYAGRKSASPDISYAGAKFSEAPSPDRLPMPPARWVSSFSVPELEKPKSKTCPQTYTNVQSQGQSEFEKITRDLKMLLKVES